MQVRSTFAGDFSMLGKGYGGRGWVGNRRRLHETSSPESLGILPLNHALGVTFIQSSIPFVHQASPERALVVQLVACETATVQQDAHKALGSITPCRRSHYYQSYCSLSAQSGSLNRCRLAFDKTQAEQVPVACSWSARTALDTKQEKQNVP